MMTKKATKEVPVYIARQRRGELDGGVYDIGDETQLEGLSAEQIGYVVGKGYYAVKNYDALSDDQVKEIEKYKG
jgi:hypothetical protein